jgi:hypothetical protein
MFTIRKVERKTIWQATTPVSLNPEIFNKLKSFPYTSSLGDESDFLNYIKGLYELDYEEKENIFQELKESGSEDQAKLLETLFDFDMEIYSDSSYNGEDSWFESGNVNPNYRGYGGFESVVSTSDED